MRNERSFLRFLPLLFVLSSSTLAGSDERCPARRWDETTNDWYFSASSDQGATGDIVAVDFWLTVEEVRAEPASLVMVLCFDPTALELLDAPLFTPEFESVAPGLDFLTMDNGPVHPRGEDGFVIVAGFGSRAEEALSSGDPLAIGTVYFRVLAEQGSTDLRFCDKEWVLPSGSCQDNVLVYEGPYVVAKSGRHVAGTIRVLPGEATRTEIPDLPPRANIYQEAPQPETTEILFELSGAVAAPGARDVPLHLHVTSSHEFSNFSASLIFPPLEAEVTRVEEPLRPGTVVIDNEAGHVAVVMMDSTRRVGAERERVEIATIYVNLKDAAAAQGAVEFSFEEPEGFRNWVVVRHVGGSNAEFPVATQVEPVFLVSPLRIQSQPTYAGDVNLDYRLELTDAILTLGHLFLGERGIVCEGAADFTGDGKVNITDPIALLRHLFGAGSTGEVTPTVLCE